MQTECTLKSLKYQDLFDRKVISDFNGVNITLDAGGLLLREISRGKGIISGFLKCFKDYRCPEKIEHRVEELIGQRVYCFSLGYEDLSDHNDLRNDYLLSTLVGKKDPTGQYRKMSEDKGHALVGKSTLNRLELTPADANEENRYKKIVYSGEMIDKFFLNMFLNSYKTTPECIVLDVDATDDPTHGNQEGRFFYGYYGHYCFLPLYIFCDDHVLCARLRPSNIDLVPE